MKKSIIALLICSCFSLYAAKVSFIKTEQQAAQIRLLLTDNAKDEILVSYFIFDDDRIGLSGLVHLIDLKKSKPELKIKLLLDASSNNVDFAILHELENRGIEIKEFHPTPKLFPARKNRSLKKFVQSVGRVNIRMHDKLLIVDGQHLITGGRNVKKDYYGMNETNFHDRDVYTTSLNASTDARNYFLALWESAHTSKIAYKKKHVKGLQRQSALENITIQREKLRTTTDFSIHDRAELILEEFIVDDDKVKFLSSYDEVNEKFFPKLLSDRLLKIALGAQSSLIIETPYLLPTKRFLALSEILEKKGVDLKVITNSYCSTDVAAVASAYDKKKKKILKNGIELYEYKGPNYLHAKSAVIDEKISLIGTYNMDPRSAYINTEVAVVIDDIDVARRLLKDLKEDEENSVFVYLNDQNKVRGSFDDCNKSCKSKVIYWLFKPFVPVFYNLL